VSCSPAKLTSALSSLVELDRTATGSRSCIAARHSSTYLRSIWVHSRLGSGLDQGGDALLPPCVQPVPQKATPQPPSPGLVLSRPVYAIEVAEPGDAEVLRLVRRADPPVGAGDVLVQVVAATVNPTDIAARRGKTRGGATPPYVPGWDFCGEVREVGDGVDDLAVGQLVAGMIPWYDAAGRIGAYASHIAVPAEWAVPIPEGVDPVVAATVPLNGLTAAQGLELLDLAAGGVRLLVTGASGAVGAFAVQLASSAGLAVTAVCAAGDEDWVRSCGARHVVPRGDARPVERFGYAFDAVPVGADLLDWLDDGADVVTTRSTRIAPERAIRHRAMLVRPDRRMLRELLAGIAAGLLASRVAEVLPLADAVTAHRRVEAGGLRGKVMLRP
jgi:NADPH:quinone reductase-like Zn-dependent oxidoreductase